MPPRRPGAGVDPPDRRRQQVRRHPAADSTGMHPGGQRHASAECSISATGSKPAAELGGAPHHREVAEHERALRPPGRSPAKTRARDRGRRRKRRPSSGTTGLSPGSGKIAALEVARKCAGLRRSPLARTASSSVGQRLAASQMLSRSQSKAGARGRRARCARRGPAPGAGSRQTTAAYIAPSVAGKESECAARPVHVLQRAVAEVAARVAAEQRHHLLVPQRRDVVGLGLALDRARSIS